MFGFDLGGVFGEFGDQCVYCGDMGCGGIDIMQVIFLVCVWCCGKYCWGDCCQLWI